MTKTDIIRVVKAMQTRAHTDESALWGLHEQISCAVDDLADDFTPPDRKRLMDEIDDAVSTAQTHTQALEHIIERLMGVDPG